MGADSWLAALALQGATYAVPIVAMYNLRDTTSVGSQAKVPPNEIWRVSDIANPTIAEQMGYVTPNVNVIYGFGFMDLAQQPIILKAPDSEGRYYMIEICDMWTNAFAYVGGIATGYKGGTFVPRHSRARSCKRILSPPGAPEMTSLCWGRLSKSYRPMPISTGFPSSMSISRPIHHRGHAAHRHYPGKIPADQIFGQSLVQ